MRDLLARPGLRRIIVVSGVVIAGVDLYSFFMPIYGHSLGLGLGVGQRDALPDRLHARH